MPRYRALPVALAVCLAGVAASVETRQAPARQEPTQNCRPLTQANATASAGAPNVNHDGTALTGQPAPDISRGFQRIPRSAQPPLTASQRRILECTYHLPQANTDVPYALFVPSTYVPGKPAPLVVDLHGLNITPLQQILFDGTTDFAERAGFIVLAPMGFNLASWWGSRAGMPVATAAIKQSDVRYTNTELSELDAMTVLGRIRAEYTIDTDRIYLMGHSMGGAGTYHLGGKYRDIWAAVAPLSGAGGLADAKAAQAFTSFATLIMHGASDSIVPASTSRRSAMALQAVGAQHLYLEMPGMDHEFWIRRGAEHMEKVFLFFSTVSKRTNPGPITPEMLPAPRGAGPASR